jgi:serine/threonine protein kinase
VDASALSYPDYFTCDASDFIGRLIKKNPKERMDMQAALHHPFLTKYQF